MIIKYQLPHAFEQLGVYITGMVGFVHSWSNLHFNYTHFPDYRENRVIRQDELQNRKHLEILQLNSTLLKLVKYEISENMEVKNLKFSCCCKQFLIKLRTSASKINCISM
jgi:hypothetical protein